MPRFVANLDLTGNQILNVRAQVLATDPGSPAAGQFWFNSASNVLRYYTGSTVIDVTGGTIADVLGTAPIVVTGGATKTVSIDPATGSTPGSMSAADKTKLDAATNAPTANTLVMRDGAGEIEASLITGDLLGTADNANQLGGNNPAHYLARANHTGTQAAATISDFDTQVRTSRLDQMAAPTAAVSANGQRITNLATPTSDNDAATKAYADAAVLGAPTKFATSIGTGSATTITVTHNLGTRDVVVRIFEAASPWREVYAEVELPTGDTADITFGAAPTSNQYRVVVVG